MSVWAGDVLNSDNYFLIWSFFIIACNRESFIHVNEYTDAPYNKANDHNPFPKRQRLMIFDMVQQLNEKCDCII